MEKDKNTGQAENRSKVITFFEAQLASHGGDIYAWARAKMKENNEFRGTHMNEENMERLTKLTELANVVCETDKHLDMKIMPPLNRTHHGMVQLICPSPVSFWPDAAPVVSEMFSLADDIGFAVTFDAGKQYILVSFGVMDIWEA